MARRLDWGWGVGLVRVVRGRVGREGAEGGAIGSSGDMVAWRRPLCSQCGVAHAPRGDIEANTDMQQRTVHDKCILLITNIL